MPVLSRFYGIIIRMYFLQSEHNPPHIHAIYNEDVAAIDFMTGEVLEVGVGAHTPDQGLCGEIGDDAATANGEKNTNAELSRAFREHQQQPQREHTKPVVCKKADEFHKMREPRGDLGPRIFTGPYGQRMHFGKGRKVKALEYRIDPRCDHHITSFSLLIF